MAETPFYPVTGIRKLFSRWQWTRDGQSTNPFRSFYLQFFGKNEVTIEVDPDDCRTAYEDCPPLGAVIDRGAKYFSNGVWKCVDIKDEKKEFPDDEGLLLLRNPNPEQRSGTKFLMDYWISKHVFANVFIRKVGYSSLAIPKALRVLPADQMEIRLTNKFYDQYELEGMFKGFTLCEGGGVERNYELKDIIYEADNFSYKQGKGVSKIPSLNYSINNIIAAYKTRNILIVNKGLLGFVGPDGGKDGTGMVMPMKDDAKKLVEKQFEKDTNLYSPDPKIKIVTSPVRWNQMGSDTKSLMLFEETDDGLIMICGMYDTPKELFIKDATFENKNEAKKAMYTDNVIPVAKGFAELMSDELGATERGRKYILDYSHVPVLQQDEKKKAETKKVKVDIASKLLSDGVISYETYALLAEVDLTGTKKKMDSSLGGLDQLGKVPLALQQLSLSRARLFETNPTSPNIAQLDEALNLLTAQLIALATSNPDTDETN